MVERRPTGALEAAVLSSVWDHPDGVTPGQVLEEVDADLAYTTVMTILSRLWQKGMVERQRRGRAYVYRAAVSEEDLAAQRMQAVLRPVRDRAAALERFVGSLSKRDERTLRRLMGTQPDPR